MKFTQHKHALPDLWSKYPMASSSNPNRNSDISIEHYLLDLVALGPSYSYVLDNFDGIIFQISENIVDIHGINQENKTLQEIIDLVHPDDLPFIFLAEEICIQKLKELGSRNLLSLRISYCFRMKIKDGSYHLFHHQAVLIGFDEQNKLSLSLNIHTDIDHITQINNKLLLFKRFDVPWEYLQFDLSDLSIKQEIPRFTKRELEILTYIADGFSSRVISEKLFLSVETVRTHRKNVLRKAKVNSNALLIKRGIEWGLI